MEMKDLLIIGAGWRGLAMAKTYHQVHPDAELLILDAAETVGGVWAEERVYPGLHTNNPLGTYEFSDFPMTFEIAGCGPFDPIPGMGVHRYLCEAAKFFDIEQYLRLGCKVLSAKLRDDDTWEIECLSGSDSNKMKTVRARKLVVATGLASEPYMPSIPGQEEFKGMLFHSKDLRSRAKEFSAARKVIVLGGNKSAYDVCYQVACNGGEAHIILRPSGGGPSFQWPSLITLFGRITAVPVLTATRFFTLFDPWPFAVQASWLQEFLHNWIVGQMVTREFWRRITAAYTRRLMGDQQTEKLIPWTSTYWMGTSLGTLNYPEDWHGFVREGRIVVHHADVASLSSAAVNATDGMINSVDAVVCCTGWSATPQIQFLPADLNLGFSSLPLEAGDECAMARRARQSLLKQRPVLDSSPRANNRSDIEIFKDKDADANPCRLYRYMIPPTEQLLQSRNLAFNAVDNPLHFVAAAQIQALWITAFFDNKIPHLYPDRLNLERVRSDTILLTEYGRLRRPKIAGGMGERYGEYVFDCLPYMDMLLHDLGLRTRRKRTLYQEWFEPYGLADYKNLVGEWLSLDS